MANNTYTALASQTLTSAQTTVTFSSIPQTYTDLVLIITHKVTSSATAADGFLRFNSDSGANYSWTNLNGNGTTLTTARPTNQTGLMWNIDDTSISSLIKIDIMNYSSTTLNKTSLMRQNQPNYMTSAVVGLWRSTAAINSISITASDNYGSGGTPDQFAIGSTFTLYGIAAASTFVKASGGIVSASDGYVYHTFTSSGTFTPTTSLTADILCVGGGGGGARFYGGGGGAGGVLSFTNQTLALGSNFTVTVGSGGAGYTGTSPIASMPGTVGGDSQFGALTLVKGGGAGGGGSASGQNGGTGGSGGGGGGTGTASGGSATSGQGFAGGSTTQGGGGGGGAGAVGNNSSGGVGATGGIGSSAYSSWGLATTTGQNVSGTVYYAGGGGGSGSGAAAGGNGGGGRGASDTVDGSAGTANTGGGGGGGSFPNASYYFGKNGGSGIVIIRYPK